MLWDSISIEEVTVLKIKISQIIQDFVNRIKNDDISAWAAQLTFYILLSIFPFLIFIMELLNNIKFYNIEAVYDLTGFFPEEIISILEYLISDLSHSKSPSSIVPITIIATIWAASKGILALIKGLNMAYKEKETRSYFFLRGMSLLYTVGFAIMLVVVLGFIVFGGKFINLIFTYIPILSTFKNILNLFRYLLTLIFTFLFFTLLYNATPNRKISFKDVTPGALFATLAWIVVSFGFSIYVNNSSNLSYLYGSLTSIIILLLWLYFTSLIIMIGGEINAITSEHAIKRKRTTH